MICSSCGYKSPEGMGNLESWYHHDCVMKGKCKLLEKKELGGNDEMDK